MVNSEEVKTKQGFYMNKKKSFLVKTPKKVFTSSLSIKKGIKTTLMRRLFS